MTFRNLSATLILTAAVAAGSARAQDAARGGGYPSVPVLATSSTVMGEPIRYPTTGPARVIASIITLAPGERTILHTHGVPLFAYILDGTLTVDYGERGRRDYLKGQAAVETLTVPHYGINTTSEPVRLLAVYIGAEGSDDVIPTKQ